MDTTVAQTIFEQMGGRKMKVMTGAYAFVASPNGLSFRIPGKGFARHDINFVSVVLDPCDTYSVTFSRIRGRYIKEISKHGDIYNDSLAELFERETGLRTRL